MKWINSRSASGHEIYELYKGESKLLTLSFNPLSNSARIEFDKEKRVLLVRKEGFRRKKTVVRTEYGVKIGELGHDQNHDFIEVNEERFFYSTRNNPLPELVLYKETIDLPLISCRMDTEHGKTAIAFDPNSNLQNFSQSGLLIALCWYLFLPVSKENTVEYAQ